MLHYHVMAEELQQQQLSEEKDGLILKFSEILIELLVSNFRYIYQIAKI